MTNPNSVLPAIALRGTTILPGMIVHFDVSRERSIKAIEAAMIHDQKIFLITQKNPEMETPGSEDVYTVGTIAYIKQVVKLPHNLFRVLVEGIEKAYFLKFSKELPYLEAEIASIQSTEETTYPPAVREAMYRSIRELFDQYSSESGKVGKDLRTQIMNISGVEDLIEQISVNIPLSYQNKQKILEAATLQDRYELVGAILSNEIDVIHISKDLQKKVKAHIDKNQREFILREQMKVIREELGEDGAAEEKEFRKRADALIVTEEIREKIHKEIDKFKMLNANSAENSVIRGYIETLLELPWDKKTEDSDDLKKAWKVLEEGHYGLKDVKERIMEFLAVRKLTNKGKSPIICLVGPPGTGKTSIAKSVADALNKKYVRVCLGGVRDEAEVRGHRKTYVGAMPGRITAALKQAGTANPLMLLDEIDKTSSDYKGDTSAALLEVLDPEQNSRFVDHYVELPQDLSEVLFIATANDVQGIPRPLLDRMELIEISGYTENEKEHIAREHLIPKQMKENGIPKGTLTIHNGALRKIINNYTKEAGVRGLERTIGKICRKTARIIMEEDKQKVNVTGKTLSEYLGKERYNYLMANKKDEIGIVRGLAWTQVGGDTLQIEVNILPGKGDVILTGQLGDVMKESAKIGFTYIRSIASKYQIDPKFFQEHDMHIHIPAGAVPKDGPSAGITMATAMLSAIIEKPVRADLAMTGEISLRGRALPIGGLKEKLLAAKYAKIKKVLVPKENKPDIEEIDKEILDGLELTFVETMDDVLEKAFRK